MARSFPTGRNYLPKTSDCPKITRQLAFRGRGTFRHGWRCLDDFAWSISTFSFLCCGERKHVKTGHSHHPTLSVETKTSSSRLSVASAVTVKQWTHPAHRYEYIAWARSTVSPRESDDFIDVWFKLAVAFLVPGNPTQVPRENVLQLLIVMRCTQWEKMSAVLTRDTPMVRNSTGAAGTCTADGNCNFMAHVWPDTFQNMVILRVPHRCIGPLERSRMCASP